MVFLPQERSQEIYFLRFRDYMKRTRRCQGDELAEKNSAPAFFTSCDRGHDAPTKQNRNFKFLLFWNRNL